MTELILDVRDRPRPGLCLWTAERRVVLTQGGDPLLLAVVERGDLGVDFYRTASPLPLLPPLRAADAEAYADRPERWAHRFADLLTADPDGPLHDGRWVLTSATGPQWNRHGRNPAAFWSELVVDGHPDGYVDWFVHDGSWELLPLRPLPEPDDARVKAYRKQARAGLLPPLLLWWVSGLDCYVVLDGHARLTAALAEDVEPPVLVLRRTVPHDERERGEAEAAARYEAELTRSSALMARHGPAVPDGAEIAGGVLARRLEELRTGNRPSWAWPLPGGERAWHRIVRDLSTSTDTGLRSWAAQWGA
ncbi:hypothetical protein GPZ77_28805 [Streptomyces sp. QHH-9511]|uniref:hypothetical protein n=1 Tax=Streptomyces sp. QHH-9511 TaxID=2684468 RepID=UPI00131697AB|nr:hypothetical protein [Streptomyces sp. QHH-9511]QGZ51845.1 hypothetical protein GPZ77_28805 [Streptomyces sp. QHH-9511]